MPALPPPLPTSGNQLVELLQEAMQAPLEAAFADVVDGLRQPMLDRLERMELDRAPYLEGLLALKDRRELILRGFREDMAMAWRTAAAGEAPVARFGQEQAGSDLGLVEEDELDVRLAAGRPVEMDLRIRSKAGVFRWASFRVKPVHGIGLRILPTRPNFMTRNAICHPWRVHHFCHRICTLARFRRRRAGTRPCMPAGRLMCF